MDCFSVEGELVNIHNAFHQGSFQQVVDFDPSTFSATNHINVQVLQCRARIAMGQYDEVLSEINSKTHVPDLAAVKILAEYEKDPWDDENAIEASRALSTMASDNPNVQICCGIVLCGAGKEDEALALLAKHQDNLDALALIIQIYLRQNRSDLAVKEIDRARKWAQDSLLLNLAEAWVGIRQGGNKYQHAFYVFEELAQAPNTQAMQSLLGQAVADLHLGHLPEAEAVLQQIATFDDKNPELLANKVVLNAIMGSDTAMAMKELESVQPKHQILMDAAAKKEAFHVALDKYTPRFEV